MDEKNKRMKSEVAIATEKQLAEQLEKEIARNINWPEEIAAIIKDEVAACKTDEEMNRVSQMIYAFTGESLRGILNAIWDEYGWEDPVEERRSAV